MSWAQRELLSSKAIGQRSIRTRLGQNHQVRVHYQIESNRPELGLRQARIFHQDSNGLYSKTVNQDQGQEFGIRMSCSEVEYNTEAHWRSAFLSEFPEMSFWFIWGMPASQGIMDGYRSWHLGWDFLQASASQYLLVAPCLGCWWH